MTPTPITRAMREAAEKATAGPWTGDRVDGTVKYDLLGADGSIVVRGDNNNSESGPYGFEREEDELFVRLANPANVLALLDALEEAKIALAPLAARCEDGVNPDDHDGSGLTVKVFSLRAARKAFLRIHTLSGEGE